MGIPMFVDTECPPDQWYLIRALQPDPELVLYKEPTDKEREQIEDAIRRMPR